MRKFQKKPELLFITVPGHGRISDNRVLEGEHFARFVPSLLVELESSEPAEVIRLPDEARASVSEVKPALSQPIAIEPAPAPQSILQPEEPVDPATEGHRPAPETAAVTPSTSQAVRQTDASMDLSATEPAEEPSSEDSESESDEPAVGDTASEGAGKKKKGSAKKRK